MAKWHLKRYLKEDALEDGPFGASCDDDQQRAQQLAQFDCSLRLYEFTEEKKVWMTAARNVALQIYRSENVLPNLCTSQGEGSECTIQTKGVSGVCQV